MEDKHMSEETTVTPAETEAEAVVEAPDSQELGDGGKKALQAERDARKQAEKTAAELSAKLKSFEDANLSELERAKKAADEAAAELASLRSENVRNKVALDKGVPADLVEFLTGDTEGDIAAKADLLLARLNTPGTPKPDPSQGAKGEAAALNGDPLLSTIKSKLGLN
jgi:broad specificity phosphatase PhoE